MKEYPRWIRLPSSVSAPLIMWVISLFPNIYVFGASTLLWFAYFFFLYFKFHVSKHQTALNCMTAASFVILLFLVESGIVRTFLILFSTVIFFFIAYWSEPRLEHALHIKEKPLRRMMMMLYVFNVYSFFIGLFAADVYFTSLSFVWLSIAGGIYAGLGAYLVWNLYFNYPLREVALWLVIISVCSIEYMWVLQLMPFGYLVPGFLIVWVWYIVQLLVRFHLSPQGIVWKQQRIFLAVNALLYILVLYSIRWI